jgi:hypothetical protein
MLVYMLYGIVLYESNQAKPRDLVPAWNLGLRSLASY